MTEGDKCIAFAEKLCNPDGTDWAGQPIRLLQWQKDFICTLLDLDENKKRSITEARLWLGRGNGKTTLIAIITCWLLFRQQHGSLVCVANTKEQASILYNFVASMIRQDEYLHSQCRIYKGNVRKILCRKTHSELTVFSSEAIGKLGGNVSVFIADEMGFWKDGTIWGVVRSSMGKRVNTQGLILGISTSGMDTTSFGYTLFTETQEAIKEKRKGFYGLICQGNPDKWDDPEEWYRSQPSYRDLMTKEYIETFISEAKTSPSRYTELLRYYMNLWTSENGSEPWIPVEKWTACNEEIDPASLHGKEAWVGLDIGSRNDMSCAALLVPLANDRFYFEPHYFTPQATLGTREAADRAPYSAWLGKYLTAIEGDYMDSGPAYDLIASWKNQFDIKGIGIDQAHNAADITAKLQSLYGVEIVQWVQQGWKTVVPATKEIERLVYNKLLIYNNNPVLKWNAGNVKCKQVDETNWMPSKRRSAGRIDGIFALIDSLFLQMKSRQQIERYEAGGILL